MVGSRASELSCVDSDGRDARLYGRPEAHRYGAGARLRPEAVWRNNNP